MSVNNEELMKSLQEKHGKIVELISGRSIQYIDGDF